MAKTGRNDPCPCGSGKKYKRCCSAKDEAAATAAASAQVRHDAARALRATLEVPLDAYDGLDEASNAVVDMVDAGRLDEAEAAAHELLVRFPDVHDGWDRLGMVCEARGDKEQAAAYYRKVVEFARLHEDRYDPSLADRFQAWADELDPPTTG